MKSIPSLALLKDIRHPVIAGNIRTTGFFFLEESSFKQQQQRSFLHRLSFELPTQNLPEVHNPFHNLHPPFSQCLAQSLWYS